jgi:hypothetical protein
VPLALVSSLALICIGLGGVAGSKTALADETAPSASAEVLPSSGWLSKWTVDRNHPEAHIPSDKDRNAEPLQFGYWLQDLIWKAEHSAKTGDHAQAVKYYVALATAVPDRAVGFTLACQEYEALGELDHAINACGQGLLRDGVVVKDYIHFVYLVLDKPQLRPQDMDAIATVLAHMRQDPVGRDAVDDLECEVGVRTSNVAQLRECTAGLLAHGANDPKLLAYQWNLAVQENKFGLARTFIDRAKAKGVPPDKVAQMQKVTSAHRRWYWIRSVGAFLAFALLLVSVGAAARAIIRRVRGRRTGSDRTAVAASSSASAQKAPVPS